MSRASQMLLIALGVTLLAGCARSTAPKAVSPKPQELPAADTRFVPGAIIGGLRHDRAHDESDSVAALTQLRRELGSMLQCEYEYGRPDDARLPDTAKEFIARARGDLIPVFRLPEPIRSGGTIFENSIPETGEYVYLVRLGDDVVGAYEWSSAQEYGGPRHSFYASFFLDFDRAERLVRDSFGGQVDVRYVRVPRGYWVVGRRGGEERGAFVCHQGSYEDDPSWERLYSTVEVLKYGNRHANGD